MNIGAIEAIVFDLGGVIINLAVENTIRELAKTLGVSPNTLMHAMQEDEDFHQYERGFISDTEFLGLLESFTPKEVSQKDLVTGWNAMLLDIPTARLSLLKELAQNYRLFVLSNTNALHIKEFNNILKDAHGYEDLNALGVFEKVYYSFEIGRRKPDVEIFSYVVQDAKLDPSKTLFLDDGEANLLGAEMAGLQTQLVTNEHTILEIFA